MEGCGGTRFLNVLRRILLVMGNVMTTARDWPCMLCASLKYVNFSTETVVKVLAHNIFWEIGRRAEVSQAGSTNKHVWGFAS